MSSLTLFKRVDIIKMFSDTSRYLDNIFNIDNPEYEKHNPTFTHQNVHVSFTRATRGTDRSPEYNEHFCQKLDFLANQKNDCHICEISPNSKQDAQRPYIKHSLGVSSALAMSFFT